MLLDLLDQFVVPVKNILPKLPPIVLALVLGIIIIKILIVISRQSLRIARVPKALSSIILSILTIILWVLLFSEIAREMGMTSVALTVSGSLIIIGLALSNGATALTSDIIAGVFLAKDPDFEIGYKIKTGDVEGIIQHVDIRKIRVIDEKGHLHVLPNANIDKIGWTVLERELIDGKIKKSKLIFRKKRPK